MIKRKIPYFLFICTVIFIGCSRPDGISWNTDLKVPLLSANFSIQDIIADSNIVANSDQTMSYRYEEQLFQINPLDSLVEIDVEPFQRALTIDELGLDSILIEEDYLMGDILEDAGLTIISDGSSIPGSLLVGLDDITPDPLDIDITSYFESAVLREGFMDLIIQNIGDPTS